MNTNIPLTYSKSVLEPTYRIKDLSDEERPRERLVQHGAERLTRAELLAILLRTGLPGENAVQIRQRLLQKFGGLEGLHRANIDDLIAERGVGPAKAAQLKAAIDLGRRLREPAISARPRITSPADAADMIRYEMSALEQERLRVLYLKTRNIVLGMDDLYQGSINASQVRIAEVFKAAIRKNAAAIIIAHNHPSGDPTPSPDDIAITRVIVKAGQLLEIQVLDHLIIGMGRFVSLKERGLGFGEG